MRDDRSAGRTNEPWKRSGPLRKKIEDNPADPKHIVTVHRLGYKLVG